MPEGNFALLGTVSLSASPGHTPPDVQGIQEVSGNSFFGSSESLGTANKEIKMSDFISVFLRHRFLSTNYDWGFTQLSSDRSPLAPQLLGVSSVPFCLLRDNWYLNRYFAKSTSRH